MGQRNFTFGLKHRLARAGVTTNLLGPAPCPIYFLRARYRRHVIIKTTKVVRVVQVLTEWEALEPRFNLASSVRLAVDVDPDNMM